MKKTIILFILILTISSCFKKDDENSLPVNEKPKQNIENSKNGEIIQENTGSIVSNNSGTLINSGSIKKENQTIIPKKIEIKTNSGNLIEQEKSNIQNTGALINTGSIVLENTGSIENKDEIKYNIIEEKEMTSKEILDYYKNILTEEDYKKLDDYLLNQRNYIEISDTFEIKKSSLYDIIIGCNNIYLILDKKLYNISYINKLKHQNIDEETYKKFLNSKYLVFLEEFSRKNNLVILQIYNLEKNNFIYSGEFIGEIYTGYTEMMSSCNSHLYDIKTSKYGYYIKDGVFDFYNGKIYKYSDTNKYKIGYGRYTFDNFFDEKLIFSYSEMTSEDYYGGFYCDEKLINNEIYFENCYKGVLCDYQNFGKQENNITEIINLYFMGISRKYLIEQSYNLKYQPTQTLEQFIETYKDANENNLEVKNIEDLGDDKYKTTVVIDNITYETIFQIMEDYKLKTISVKQIN